MNGDEMASNIGKTMYVRRLGKEDVLTIEVKITKEFKFRLAIAKALIWCAAYVLNCGIEIKKTEPF